ncbi:MAG: ATP-binding protein [Muribaculaceae bacterium]|nr:ATP-binding protein [Muribaculaceae bacterium]
MEDRERYAIGQQDFRTMRERGAFYIDKTAFVEKIARSRAQYYFLARPRRFGKSLFLSTLKYFFEGRRELFRGLCIDSADWDWQPYPVLHLDMNTDRFTDPDALGDVLERQFRGWEEEYGISVEDRSYSQRLGTILEKAHEKTGRQVVILVDEYDKPLVSNLKNTDNFEAYRSQLASIYSNFKSSAEHLRLVFITGISRFSKLSVFSDLNNLDDISFDDEYADICGITEKELLADLHNGISELAAKRKEDFAATCLKLKQSYDGYRFAPEGSDIYNPWSVLSCLKKGRIGDYWIDTGAPSVIAEALHEAHVDIEAILNGEWKLRRLAGLDLRNANPTALLYQAGYLTIADYDMEYDEVRLKVPNDEVREGLFNDLLPIYMKGKEGWAEDVVCKLKKSIRNGDPERMMKELAAYFAGIPYDLKMENENNFHNAFYILTTLIGIDAKAEVHTSDGRIDLLIETPRYIYVIELKYDGTPDEALRQIEEKGYARRFATDTRQLFKIGVNFSSETRRIEGWSIMEDIPRVHPNPT